MTRRAPWRGACQTRSIERSERQRRLAAADRERHRRGDVFPGSERPANRRRISRRNVWLLVVGCVVLVWVFSGFLLRAASSGEVLEGTSMSGVDLGGVTRDRAAGMIGGIKPQQIEVSEGPRSVTVRAQEAGLVVDIKKSADRAYSSGRSGIGAVLKGPLLLFGERDVEPVYEPTNAKRLAATVNRIADRLDRQPFVGALSIDRETLKVTFRQPKAGVRVRRNAARDELLKAVRAGDRSMELPVRRQQAPSPAEVQAVADQAGRYLRRPLIVRTAGGDVTFPPRRMATLLAIESSGDTADSGIRLGAAKSKVRSLVAKFASQRDRAARDAGLDTPPQPPVTLIEQGDLSWRPKPGVATVTTSSTGRRIRQAQAVNATNAAVRNGTHRVLFGTEPVEPKVTTESLKNSTSLLGTFTTSYTCCEPRVTNIQRMAQTVDGTVIGPGEQFSLNGVAGERTRANGYEPAPTIGEGNKLIDTIGGGVSQFSTTTYNAAYFAGLKIDAHTPHSFYIDRYPAGREATLNFGTIDLLWTNDTNAPVVVRSSASDTSVTVSLYGDSVGRRVLAETLSRTENSQGGFDITIDRVVINGDGTRTREPYTTTYGVPSE